MPKKSDQWSLFFYNIANKITAIPTITLYIAKPLKLPFFRYSNKNFIITIPTKKLASIPSHIDKSVKIIFFKSNITAATVIGVASKNEYLAALSLSIPKLLAIVIVIPERDTPGNAAAKA